MGLWEQTVQRLVDKTREWDQGKLSTENFQMEIVRGASMEKLMRLAVNYNGQMLKHGKKSGRFLLEKNIFSEGTAVDTESNPEAEKIKCDQRNQALITRAECLDYSGCKEHMDECEGCQHLKRTKLLCLPTA